MLLTAGAGYGKTTALEEAIELAGLHAVWVSCRDAGGEAGRLRSGRTSLALREFLECRRTLVVALGVEPSGETSRLQACILAGGAV